MPKHLYLYNLSYSSMSGLSNMPYKQALLFKIECAKAVLNALLRKDYMERDTQRINDVAKAIKFNEQLLDELKGASHG